MTVQDAKPEAWVLRRNRLARQGMEILEALLEKENYADLSVERLLSEFGVSRSTFYVYFEDKGALLSAVAEGVVADLLASGARWWTFPQSGTKADLRDALRPPIDTYRQNRAILRSVIEMAAYEERLRVQHTSLIDQVVDGITAHLEEAQKAGTAAPDLDARRTAAWLVWMFERGLYQLVGDASAREVNKLLDALTTVVWRTLYEGYREP